MGNLKVLLNDLRTVSACLHFGYVNSREKPLSPRNVEFTVSILQSHGRWKINSLSHQVTWLESDYMKCYQSPSELLSFLSSLPYRVSYVSDVVRASLPLGNL